MSDLKGGSYIPSNAQQSELPLLSIIMVTLNRSKYLDSSIANVFHEILNDYPNTELIIIDGGSKDDTVNILRKYDKYITHWISEPDSGAGDAVNKGLNLAKGEIVRLLGDDDELIPGNLSYMVRYMISHPEIDTLLGHGEYYQEDINSNIVPFTVKQPVGPIEFRDFFEVMSSLAPELQFSRRWVFEKYAGYDLSYRYLGCFDMWLRHAQKGVRFEVIPQVITKRIITTTSPNNPISSAKHRKLLHKEYYKILRRHGGIHTVAFYYLKSHFWRIRLLKKLLLHPNVYVPRLARRVFVR